jgi:hypothetical protein
MTAVESSSQQTILQFELEKERILRQNLEKSYHHLLDNLRERELVFNFAESQYEDEYVGRAHPHTDRTYAGSPKNGHHDKSRGSLSRRNSCGNLQEISHVET